MSWPCKECGHNHAGQSLGYICIGCPCNEVPAGVCAFCRDSVASHTPTELASCSADLDEELR